MSEFYYKTNSQFARMYVLRIRDSGKRSNTYHSTLTSFPISKSTTYYTYRTGCALQFSRIAPSDKARQIKYVYRDKRAHRPIS
jgi:hypothetical protein